MFTATLVYAIGVGFQIASGYVGAVGAIDLYELPAPGQGVLTLLGMDVVSDTTLAPTQNELTRTIVLATNAQGDSMYNNVDDVKDALRSIFTAALSLRIPGQVVASEPVVV